MDVGLHGSQYVAVVLGQLIDALALIVVLSEECSLVTVTYVAITPEYGPSWQNARLREVPH